MPPIYGHYLFSYSDLLAHLVYQPKSQYNHALPIGVGVTVGVVVCVQSS